jgi:menaquinol-cytochrome c reductase iron-sulfur subunit
VANGNDSPHVPPPSLWPVGFALGVVCILVGAVVSWTAAAVGAAVAIVFGFLWARDVMGAHRAAAAAAHAGPEEHVEAPPAPAQAGGPAMPEPSAAEVARFPRSRFLEASTLGVGGLIGGAVTVPAVGLMVVPAFVKQGHKGIDLGPLSDFPEGEWLIATFLLEPKQGEVSRRTAYIRNNGVKDGKPSFTIISNRCAHLGCPVQPGGLVQNAQAKTENEKGGQLVKLTPVLGLSSFTCPCHGGSYDDEGNRVAGPPVRGLDRYDFSVVDGHLILGNAFSVRRVRGKGADAQITKYQLSGPGQHLDGLEGWLYPWQPPH